MNKEQIKAERERLYQLGLKMYNKPRHSWTDVERDKWEELCKKQDDLWDKLEELDKSNRTIELDKVKRIIKDVFWVYPKDSAKEVAIKCQLYNQFVEELEQ
jgi:hypothetical protein